MLGLEVWSQSRVERDRSRGLTTCEGQEERRCLEITNVQRQ